MPESKSTADRVSVHGSGRGTLPRILLGFLGVRPMTGYDIKTTFDRSIATYWNASHSQIYTTLRALESEGLVESTIVYQETRPNRRLYQLTPAGEQELRSWLAEPVPGRFTKDEYLAKLFFCGESGDETALHHLDSHLRAVDEQLAHLATVRQTYEHRVVRRPRLLEFQLLVLDYKEATLRADRAITERAIDRLHARARSAEAV